jgi:DHA1 family bicyclomycin/chloramphenicol resistance-like MFS transporter
MPPRTGPGLIALLTALTASGVVATSIYLPSLPAIAADLGASVSQTQFTLTVFLLGYAIAHLVYGPLSDRYGRRPVLLGGLALFAAASIACGLAPDVELLIAARLAQAIGACAGPVIARAVVRDLFERERMARVMAWIGTALALAPAAAPVIGGNVEVWLGWRANFAVVTLFGAVVLWLCWRHLGETNTRPRDRGGLFAVTLSDYRALARSREFLAYSAIVGFGFAALFGYFAGAPIVLIELLGVTPDVYGYLSLIGVGGYACGSYLTGRLAHRASLDRLVLAGVVVAFGGGASMAALALAGTFSIVAILGPMFVYSVGMGFFLPHAITGAIGPYPEMAGAASALMGFVQNALGALGSLAVAAFATDTQVPMTCVVAAMTGASLLAYLALGRGRSTARRRVE